MKLYLTQFVIKEQVKMFANPPHFSASQSRSCPECRVRYSNFNRQAKTIDSCGHLKCESCVRKPLFRCNQCENEKKRQYVLDLSPNHSGQKLTYLEFSRGIEVTVMKEMKHNTALTGSSASSRIKPDISEPLKEVHKEPPARRSARVRNESQPTHQINSKIALSSRTRSVARAKRQIRKPIQQTISHRRKRKALPSYEMVDGKRQCPFCRKLFSLNSNFGRHIRLHTEAEKKFKCGPCNKVFSRNENLLRHQRSTFHIKNLQIESGS